VTPKQLHAARGKLGKLAGLDRPLSYSEMGRALRLQGDEPGQSVRKWEQRDGPSGPASVAIEMMLAGAEPPDGWESIVQPVGRPEKRT
jgi:hypothetical protein